MRLILGTVILSLAVGTEHSAYYGWCVFGLGLMLSKLVQSKLLEE